MEPSCTGRQRGVIRAFAPEPFWGLLQRIGVALGFVLGVALLGALAFINVPDVIIMWHDEQGRRYVGFKRTETQRRLEQVEEEIGRIKSRHSSARYSYSPWISPHTRLRLLATPDRRGRVLKEISSSARNIVSTCKLEVADDDLYVEVSYQGETGWVNGLALSPSR